MKDMLLVSVDFSALLDRDYCNLLRGQERIAVAVSGGPDSMALCHMLLDYVRENGGAQIEALHVDHGLRTEAAAEARELESRLAGLGVECTILRWEGDKPERKIQESARAARYLSLIHI